jgi:hypothetical protein
MTYELTQAPSWIEVMRGAYGDVGKVALLFGEDGEPSPYIPVEYLLLEDVESCGLAATRGCGLFCPWERFEDELDDCNPEGGVCEPTVELSVEVDFVVGTVPSLVLLDSTDLSVRKLALERLRRSLRKEGAMMACKKRSVSDSKMRCYAMGLCKRT